MDFITPTKSGESIPSGIMVMIGINPINSPIRKVKHHCQQKSNRENFAEKENPKHPNWDFVISFVFLSKYNVERYEVTKILCHNLLQQFYSKKKLKISENKLMKESD